MRFYDLLQLDPAVVKQKLRAAQTTKERARLWLAMGLRSALIVLFAILCIAPVGKYFGPQNSPMGVALFCLMLGFRFVDFGYCIKDSLLNLGITFFLLLVSPVAASLVNPVFAVCIHALSFFIILLMASDNPIMGNGGMYGFAYVFLSGNPVTGELFYKRAAVALIGYVICAAIFYAKHRKKHQNIRFREVAARFDLTNEKSRWQLRMALGVGLVLTLGYFSGIKHFMWMGFSCAAMLSTYPYSVNIKSRCIHRMIGVVCGSLAFFAIYLITPPSLTSLLGPLGGFFLGFCTDYRFKSGINCFGALMMAAGIYGIHSAVLLRVVNNLFGVLLALGFIYVYDKLIDQRYVPLTTREELEELEQLEEDEEAGL